VLASGRRAVPAGLPWHTDDPTPLVLHTFDSVEAALSFVKNPELAQRMKEGGVVGPPRIEIFETV
jgi:hypothetical protein